VQTERVDGSNGERVYVRFYADGSARLSIRRDGGWRLDEAFISGGKPTFIVRLVPR
jgi:hypothetical protein